MPDDGPKNDALLDKYLPEGVVTDAVRSALYQGIESPVNAVGQIWNNTAGTAVGEVGPLGMISAPTEAEFGTARWHAQTIGGAAGMVAPFLIARGGVKGMTGAAKGMSARIIGSASTFELTSGQGVRVLAPMLEAGATGAVFEGVFRPVEPKEGNFWEAKARNAGVGFATFSVLGGTSQGLKALDRIAYANSPWMINTFRHDVARQLAAGGAAGLADANFRSLAAGHGLAQPNDAVKSAYTFALLGGLTRTAGEVTARTQGKLGVSDVVANDRALQDVMKNSNQAHMLLSDFGEVRVKTADFKGTEQNAVNRASGLIQKLASHEAASALAPGEKWDAVARKKIAEAKKNNPTKASELEANLKQVHKEATDGGLPDKNWEQNRYAMIRERAFINDVLNNQGKMKNTNGVDGMERAWYQRWSHSVEPGQELQAKLSQSFNANHSEPASAEKYNKSMMESGPQKADVVDRHLPKDQHVTMVDIGAADGFVPDALTQKNPNVTAFALDLDPHSFLGMLAKSRTYRGSLDGGPQPDHTFRPIPIFADGVMPKLPVKAVDAFTSLSNVHELISYPQQYYGPFNPSNARMAISQWARALKDGGKIVVKDFMMPEVKGTDTVVLKFKDLTGSKPLTTLEGEPLAPEYLSGQAGKLWFEEFTGQKQWRANEHHAGESGEPQFETVKFKGKNLRYRWLPDGSGIECDLATAGEILVSSRYGMLETRNEMRGVADEQFMNLTRDGYSAFFRSASPVGYRLNRIGDATSKAGQDYIQHRQQYFEMYAKDPATGQLTRVDLSENNPGMHVTYQGAFVKAPVPVSKLLNLATGPLERSPLFSPLLRFGVDAQRTVVPQFGTSGTGPLMNVDAHEKEKGKNP